MSLGPGWGLEEEEEEEEKDKEKELILPLEKGEMGTSVGRAAAEQSLMPKANPTPSHWFPVVYPPG